MIQKTIMIPFCKSRIMKYLQTAILLISSLLLFNACTKTQTDYYENGQIKSVIPYRMGKENGLAVYYNKNGWKELEVMMKNGKKNGQLTRYNFNAKPEAEETYIDDVLEGKQIIYDLMGDKILEANYVHGKKNGPYTTWHYKDMLREKGAFVDDLFDGDWEYYDDRGFNVGEASFKKGTGTQTAYDAHGNIMRVTHYVNNLKDGEELSYNPQGEVIKTVIYKEDRIISVDGISVEEMTAETDSLPSK